MNNKEMKIVEAVASGLSEQRVKPVSRESTVYKITDGPYCYGYNAFTPQFICTIEEFDQCIEEMAAAKWMYTGGAYVSYSHHKKVCSAYGIDASSKTLIKENCDQSLYEHQSSAEKTLIGLGYRDLGGEQWKPPLGSAPEFIRNEKSVYTQEMRLKNIPPKVGTKVTVSNNDGYYVECGRQVIGEVATVLSAPLPMKGSVKVQSVEHEGNAYCFRSSMLHPIKSKQEIEPEEAKKRQISDVHASSVRAGYNISELYLTWMQENSLLLPLEV